MQMNGHFLAVKVTRALVDQRSYERSHNKQHIAGKLLRMLATQCRKAVLALMIARLRVAQNGMSSSFGHHSRLSAGHEQSGRRRHPSEAVSLADSRTAVFTELNRRLIDE